MILGCIECATEYRLSTPVYRCRCGGLLEIIRDLSSLREVLTREELDRRQAVRQGPLASGVWRYRELVLDVPQDQIISHPEGNTNLYNNQQISRWTDLDNLLLKHEGENPTGSFKDRGMTAGITHAVKNGASVVACASTGNTSSSLASYAALAGIRALVLMPEGMVSVGKLSQTIAYGATTLEVRGDFDQAMAIIEELSQEGQVYILNSINPYRLEGQKTIVFEMIQQMGWAAPDWIALPGGNLGNASGFGKAIEELKDLGLINRRPRLAVIQSEGANPFYNAFKNQFSEFKPVVAETLATAIRIGNPVSYRRAMRAILKTDGVVEQVSDSEILDAKAVVDRAGIGCEPASAAAVAGVRKLVRTGVIKRGETVVALLTGHMLKDPSSIIRYHLGGDGFAAGELANRPIVIEPRLDEVARVLDAAVSTR